MFVFFFMTREGKKKRGSKIPARTQTMLARGMHSLTENAGVELAEGAGSAGTIRTLLRTTRLGPNLPLLSLPLWWVGASSLWTRHLKKKKNFE